MNELLRNALMRRNSRTFSDSQLKDSELKDIIEAGKFFPNMIKSNRDWHFTVIQNKELLKKTNDLCREFYFQNGKESIEPNYSDEDLNFLFNAPTLIIISANVDDEETQNAAHATFGNMMLLADKMDIASCWNYSIKCMLDSPDGRAFAVELGIKDGYIPMSVGVFGYHSLHNAMNVLFDKEQDVRILK